MPISFTRKENERFVLIHPDGTESWCRIRRLHGSRVEIEFDPGEEVTVLRQEVYEQIVGRVSALKRDPIRPPIQAPQESPLSGTVFQGTKANL